jgi:hypothetical protein
LGYPNQRRLELKLGLQDLAPFDERKLREIAAFVDEQIKHEVADARRLRAEMLEQIEVWPARIIERDNLPIYDCVLR